MAKIYVNKAFTNKVYVFKDRYEAGEILAEMMKDRYEGAPQTVVFAIPAGGVPVGLVLAQRLKLPFDLIIVRKIHFPDNPEAGFGAISFDGEVLLNEELVAYAGLTPEVISRQLALEKKDLAERELLFRRGKPFPDLAGQTVILVDDGLASGYTMMAAVKSARRRKAGKIVVAVPTASQRALEKLSPLVEEIYCANLRSGAFFAVADAYQNWYDLGREEVISLLEKAGYYAEGN